MCIKEIDRRGNPAKVHTSIPIPEQAKEGEISGQKEDR